ncbi:hypothetical protein ACFQU2_35930 [Siccirubricoccus deserti]|uniref:Uncharacterized protein n=1 Tax=Siccirubricoccus deserti TaxID=2013562 RepID=A0A9X0R334_9PROT|nr:hypothetical protein [Siccirubricoccus deserti]MBC4018951.1 hypothetical protein [Siccirubricoccus deserti]
MTETCYAATHHDTAPAVCCTVVLPQGGAQFARLYGRCEVIGRQDTGDRARFQRRHRCPRRLDSAISPTKDAQWAASER